MWTKDKKKMLQAFRQKVQVTYERKGGKMAWAMQEVRIRRSQNLCQNAQENIHQETNEPEETH